MSASEQVRKYDWELSVEVNTPGCPPRRDVRWLSDWFNMAEHEEKSTLIQYDCKEKRSCV